MSEKLGATGKFPLGKLNNNDEGELRIAIGIEKNKVKIVFGKDISWFAMTPDEAINLGQAIIERATRIKVDYGEVTEDEALYFLLLMVDKDIPISTISTWNKEEKELVIIWVNRVLAKASDHKYVRIPPYPEILKKYDEQRNQSLSNS